MISTVLHDFISLFFPRYCYGCKQQLISSESLICMVCQYQLPTTKYNDLCQNTVVNKLYGKVPVKFGGAYLRFVKSGITQKLLHQLKYNNKPQIGKHFGKVYGKEIRSQLSTYDIDCIIPVPLHPRKQWIRGYNQSEMFGKGLSESLDIEIDTASLVRTKHNTTQTKKTKKERWDDVSDIFKIKKMPNNLQSKNVLLVDDVVTTGATLASCTNKLYGAGASSVGIVTIAVAEY